jgi:hypothetical protein
MRLDDTGSVPSMCRYCAYHDKIGSRGHSVSCPASTDYPNYEARHLPPFGDEVKNEWILLPLASMYSLCGMI